MCSVQHERAHCEDGASDYKVHYCRVAHDGAVFMCERGISSSSVRLFLNTYAANQLPDDLIVRRWRTEFLTGHTSLQDEAYRGRGT